MTAILVSSLWFAIACLNLYWNATNQYESRWGDALLFAAWALVGGTFVILIRVILYG